MLLWPWSPTRNQAANGGLGPQRGTKLRHNGEGPPSLSLPLSLSLPPSLTPSLSVSRCPFLALGLLLIARPRGAPVLNGARRASLARAVFITRETARFACALLAGASGDSSAGRWGPCRGLLYLLPWRRLWGLCRLCIASVCRWCGHGGLSVRSSCDESVQEPPLSLG